MGTKLPRITAFTGHRRVAGAPGLKDFAIVALKEEKVEEAAIGMALGWDMAVAEACVELGIPFVAHIPFKEQCAKWPAEEQIRWMQLLNSAKRVIVHQEQYTTGCLNIRNCKMIDTAVDVIALYDGSQGGTEHAIRYADRKRKPFINVWPKWKDHLKWQKTLSSGNA